MVDVPADATTTAVLEFDPQGEVGTYSGRFDFPLENDWIRVTLEQGVTYQFFLSAQHNGSATGNSSLSLYDSTGAQVASDDDSGAGDNSFEEFTPTSSGTYYIESRGLYSYVGTYSVLMTRVAATNVFGNDNSETLTVNAGERLAAGNGNDVLTFAAGALDALGEQGDDRITGNAIQNRISGGLGSDNVDGAGGDDILFGDAGDDRLIGGEGHDHLFGGDGFDFLEANAGNDFLNGGADGDLLYGSIGNDTMDGGAGDDIAWLSTSGATVVVTLNGANNVTLFVGGVAEDTVRNVEGVIGDSGNDVLTGDAAENFFQGGNGDDTLNGGAGADTMDGGANNDHFTVDNAGDVIIEAAAQGNNDRARASVTYTLGAGVEVELLSTFGIATTAVINLTGNELANILEGNAASNVLNGAGGVDSLKGFAGNDAYIVDNASDAITEAAGQGTDNVNASVSYVLAAGVEAETLRTTNAAGTTAINLTGNDLVNLVIGNAGANILTGGAAADNLQGLGGHDSYLVDNAADVVVEAAGAGTDNVNASVSYTLAAGVSAETLRTTNAAGTTAINLTGNEINNLVIGNAGANQLNGREGHDKLTGNAGADLFFFNTALSAATNIDAVTDFSVADDTFRLENAIFTGLAAGTLNADAFHIGAAAADAEDRIIYNSATGALSFDSNGSAAGGTTLFAAMTAGLALTNADFVVV